MKNKLFSLLLLFMLFNNYPLSAQEDEDPGNEFEDGGNVESVPIGGEIIWLCLSGVIFAVFALQDKSQIAKNKKTR